jgi:hypothetical protein
MAARWAALVIAATMLAIVGVFLWAVIKPPAPPAPSATESAAGPSVGSEKRIVGPAGPWTLYAWAVPGADRAVTVTVSARDLEERPIAALAPPTATLRMLDMAMAPERVVLVPERPGFWRGSTRVSMGGRWNLHVELDGESLSLPFDAVPR